VTGKRRVAASRRAQWLPDRFDVAQRHPRVREMLQYNLFVPTTTPFTTGLLTPPGRRLPEYLSLMRWTTGAAASGRIKRNTGPIELPPRPPAGA
jgi:hypothetical protein